jgi:DNA (cytosine-5)-methyltransferase 1
MNKIARVTTESIVNDQPLINVPLNAFKKPRAVSSRKIKVLDLFAGAGGFSLGFELAGTHVKAAIELDAWACETLALNHQSTDVHKSDISKLSDKELLEIGSNCDVIIGGPPCQGFSIANRNAGDPADPRNSLFREFLRAVSLVRPKVVLMENVPGLLKRRAQSNEPVIDIIVSELEALGYYTYYKILEAQSFGVPQIRPRLFVIGYLKKPSNPFPAPTHVQAFEKNDLFSKKHNLLPYVSLWQAIGDLPDIEARQGSEIMDYTKPAENEFQMLLRAGSDNIFNSVAMSHSARMVERFSHIKCGESGMHAPAEHQTRKRGDYSAFSGKSYSQNNRRMHPEKPCHTVPASFYANFIHPYKNRNFTPREGARIQSFPDWYRFCGKPTVVSTKLLAREDRTNELHLCQYNQIGNAVPPLLAYQLAKHIISEIEN